MVDFKLASVSNFFEGLSYLACAAFYTSVNGAVDAKELKYSLK